MFLAGFTPQGVQRKRPRAAAAAKWDEQPIPEKAADCHVAVISLAGPKQCRGGNPQEWSASRFGHFGADIFDAMMCFEHRPNHRMCASGETACRKN